MPCVRAGRLIIGFKSPQTPLGMTVLAEIDSVNALFSGQKISAKLWAPLGFYDAPSASPSRLSDMLWVGDQLFMLSVASGPTKRSLLWRLTPGDAQPTLLRRFDGLAAEGLAYRPDTHTLTVVFDEGKGVASKFESLPVGQLTGVGPPAHDTARATPP
jgi:hypothetical protein